MKQNSTKITMQEMCTIIANSKILEKQDGTNPTAEEIFNYSSTGELYMIFEWYELAQMTLACLESKSKGEEFKNEKNTHA